MPAVNPTCDTPTSAVLGHPRRQVFVQDRETSLFLTPLKLWSEDRRQARDFRTTVDAMVYCLMQEISNAQIFVTFNFPGVPDVTMAVDRAGVAA